MDAQALLDEIADAGLCCCEYYVRCEGSGVSVVIG